MQEPAPTPGDFAHLDRSAELGHRFADIPVSRPRGQASQGGAEPDGASVHEAAKRGTRGPGGPLPDLERSQRAFGRHDVSGIAAHTDRSAVAGVQAMGAAAFTQGEHIAFAGTPDLPTAAHEAAHVVQQRAGVQPAGAMGQVGDQYEPRADAVADKVASGQSAEGGLQRSAGGQGEGPTVGSAGHVVQLKRETQESTEGFRNVKVPVELLAFDLGEAREWPNRAKKIYDYIEDARSRLDDDGVSLLEEFEREVDEVVDNLVNLSGQFAAKCKALAANALAPGNKPASGAADSNADTNESPLKSLRAEGNNSAAEGNNSASRRPSPRIAAQDSRTPEGELKQISKEIIERWKNLLRKDSQAREVFPINEGSFSAKGRAHDVFGVSPKEGSNLVQVDTWFNGIALNGENLSPVYKPKDHVSLSEKASGTVLMGKKPAENISAPEDPKDPKVELERLEKLKQVEESIKINLNLPQEVRFQAAPVYKERGSGQVAAMGGTNASGYAMLAGVPDWTTQRWEWLHVRAASLGGITDGSNLVVGTRDVNTQMMPVEANIRLLSNIVKENRNLYSSLTVNFSVDGQDANAKHKVNEIKIEWCLNPVQGDPTPVQGDPTKECKGEARFAPLTTNANISKMEIGILEEKLKEHREQVKQVEQVQKNAGSQGDGAPTIRTQTKKRSR
ncbi:DUF4157 domain-containing protein [Archangium violaceum]|uniref:eCIS core domain-containing protein n=1 Tax=Archangium violaceum TaxID=83451 RepID=UPI00193B065F|nr:DUF4157 domain-containing protein [Archangium violaceum]QRK06085.1 DUF4157 domain-containing protein [Archangium violaceum]